ncbi:MAG TPA: RagB/SusD family nutrient uptake outer membrane protein [Chitinophaga sp.]
MKRYTIYALILLALFASSCEKKFLDKKPLDSYSDADVWKELNLTEAFVNSRYTILPSQTDLGIKKGYFMSGTSDEGLSKLDYAGESIITKGLLSPDNVVYDFWTPSYAEIRNCNLFFSKIADVPAASADAQAQKRRMQGEIYFLRAFAYADLLRHYGGVPLISKLYDLTDTSFEVKRNTYEEGVQFVLNDIDSAISILPEKYENSAEVGRATSIAAMALKSRILLYAASELNNPGHDAARWQAAETATLAAITAAEKNGAQLFDGADYKKIFLQKHNPEVLFDFNFGKLGYGGIDVVCTPNSYGGWSVYTPSQDMVDSFLMKNGKRISDPASGYDPANPYANRDPRFYADILYNGATFKGTPVEIFEGGKDSQQGPQGWNATNTGYHWRKYMDESIDVNKDASNQNWIIFRLAELYLNYAEIEAALHKEEAARTYINKIRSRPSVLMPDISSTGAQLEKDIRLERQVELCFESHRMYDVRRWKIADITENKPLKGVIVTKNGNTFSYNYVVRQERNFKPALYHWPISRDEMSKNRALVQNAGYNQ